MHDALIGRVRMADAIACSPQGIDVAPADQMLSRFETEARQNGKWQRTLERNLDEVDDAYDWCIIDTPPSLGALSINALVAATAGVLVPILPEILPLRGIQLLCETISELSALNPNGRIRCVLPTMVRTRWARHQDMVGSISTIFPDCEPATPIPNHAGFVRAAQTRSTVFDTAPASNGAAAYRSLAEWLAEMN